MNGVQPRSGCSWHEMDYVGRVAPWNTRRDIMKVILKQQPQRFDQLSNFILIFCAVLLPSIHDQNYWAKF